MASKTSASAALFLALNLLFFAMVSSCPTCPDPLPSCPVDTLKLGVCLDVLNGLIDVFIGQPPKEPCCSLVADLVDIEAAVCLCTVVKANVGGIINVAIPVQLALLVNYCGKQVPQGFICP